MRRNRQLRMLILIIAIVAVAIWFDLPNNPGIHVFGIDKAIETRLGLDLVGGVQALLEADLPKDVDIDAEAMNTARTIVENRVNGLGVSEAVVQQDISITPGLVMEGFVLHVPFLSYAHRGLSPRLLLKVSFRG